MSIVMTKQNLSMETRQNQLQTSSQTASLVHVKSEDAYADLVGGVESRFHTSNYEAERHLPTGKNKIVIVTMNDELGGRIRKNVCGVDAKDVQLSGR